MTHRVIPTEMSIRDFIAAVGSADGTHGAASAAAVAGSLGSSLLLMVAAFPMARTDDRLMLSDAAVALIDVREQLLETIETDTAVKIFAARHTPAASEIQRPERQAALQLALQAAADVSLEVLRLCARGLTLGELVAAHGNRAAAGDSHLGVALLRAAFDGARANLESRLGSLTDAIYMTAVVEEIARLSDAAAAATRAAEALLRRPPA